MISITVSTLNNSVIDDSLLFDVDKLKIDTSKLVGWAVSNPLFFIQNQNDSLLFGNILDQTAAKRVSIGGAFPTDSTIEVDSPNNFVFDAFCEEDNVTFQSLSERIKFERERVFQIIKAYFLKIRTIFANLSLVKLILFIVVSTSIFNQQFGGNRDLPVDFNYS